YSPKRSFIHALGILSALSKIFHQPYVAAQVPDCLLYIADDAERIAFIQLTTAKERDRFIEQFWERRNPSPGSLPNKFKDEHYRRISYANQRYGTAATAGWKTDRGHIYMSTALPTASTLVRRAPTSPSLWRCRFIAM